MDQSLEELLKVLEPTIDKKCIELKRKKEERKKEKLFMFTIMMFLLVPSSLIFFGINILFSFIIIATVLSIVLFTTLPFIIKIESGGICYE